MNKSLLALAAALLLVGAGCASAPAVTDEPADVITEETSTEEAGATETPAPEAEDVAVAPIEIDDTWQTYTSRAGDWQFQWPTKGRYAPQWEASFAPETEDGCYGDGERTRLQVGDAEFCRASSRDGALAIDRYVTERGGQKILLTFIKEAKSFSEADWKGYSSFLDQVVGTFKVVK